MQILSNYKLNSSQAHLAASPKQQGSIFTRQDFRGILSDEARRLGNFRTEHPGSDQAVYKSATDSSPFLSQAGKAYLDDAKESADDNILNGLAQRAKSVDFLDEYTKAQEAAQKAKEAASEVPAHTSGEAGSDAAGLTPGQAASGAPA